MRLILVTLVASLAVGLAAGGSLREFPAVRIRWAWLALLGVVLQFLVVDGTLALVALLASFALLITFAIGNLPAPGFVPILIGLALNAVVIGVNQGMPVTRHALVASGQQDTIQELAENGDGQKHFLADDETTLVFLADSIAVPAPIRQAISVGDVFVHAGVAWFVVTAMRRRKPVRNTAAAGV